MDAPGHADLDSDQSGGELILAVLGGSASFALFRLIRLAPEAGATKKTAASQVDGEGANAAWRGACQHLAACQQRVFVRMAEPIRLIGRAVPPAARFIYL